MNSEHTLITSDITLAGVDEAGRGPLAGPVVAAAVILDPENPIDELADSKKLSEKKRERLFDEIQSKALAYHIAWADVEEIDTLNILQASLLAMKRAIKGLSITPRQIIVDGTFCPRTHLPCHAVVKGDVRVPAISAASILAKVTRDREMLELDDLYPGYGFKQHKGYPTKLHLQSLKRLGVSPIHRRSFKPVEKLLNQDNF